MKTPEDVKLILKSIVDCCTFFFKW